jgi:pimeloyl-ACP methyl ester carboxylesterase
MWYQWYFQTERGHAGLDQNRRDLARLLWHLWSPNWQFDEATFAATAASFDNPDFVAVTIQSYRHRHRNAPGDPALEPLEQRLAARPPITAPTIVLHGAADGVSPVQQSAAHAAHFIGRYDRRVVPVAGHFLSRETPDAVVQALRDLIEGPR